MNFDELVARNLAAALLSVAWTEPALGDALARFLGAKRRAARGKLLEALLAQFAGPYPPSPRQLSDFLLRSDYFERARNDIFKPELALSPPLFAPAERFATLKLPRLATQAEVAAWLGLSLGELDWFTDARRTLAQARIPALRHYDYRFIPKANGSPRLLEAPRSRLKAIQRRILREILDAIPVHDAAFGFVAGRSCLSGANRHVGENIVITLDLKDFFLTTPMGRVHALFRNLGFPHAVAQCLTRLCGASTPRDVVDSLEPAQRYDAETRGRFETLHLPQGAPTSPALANLVAFRLDVRLAGLAGRFDAAYSRYADDLAFSGDEKFASSSARFIGSVAAIVADEGFAINTPKTRIMKQSARQQVTGVVVNNHLNAPREAFDSLKATLYNCARNGPLAENRDGLRDFRAHLEGRVHWFERLNPVRGARLREMFEQVAWTS